MDILKLICSEICYFVKSGFDISMQKIEQLFRRR